jgi:anti-anti-sigma factor
MTSPEQFPSQFSVLARRDGSRLRLWISGDLDAVNRDLVDAMLKAMITASDELPTEVRFNMGNVTFVDSTGLTVLLAARKIIRDVDGQVIVVRPPPMLSRLLEITALTEHFTLEPVDSVPPRATG